MHTRPSAPGHRDRGHRDRGRQAAGRFLALAGRYFADLLPVAGTLPRQVALLAEIGLEPTDAIAAASIWPRRFLEIESKTADLVAYHHDPRNDPGEIARPAAVVVQGKRIR